MIECAVKDFTDIVMRGESVVIKGIVYNMGMGDTAYDIIMENLDSYSRNLFDRYVKESLGLSKAQYNRRLHERQETNLDDIKMLVRRSGNAYEVYQYDRPGVCKQISLVTSTDDRSFEQKMVNFLQFTCGNTYFINLSAGKAKTEAKKLILNRKYHSEFNIELVSNDPEQYCNTHIGIESLLDSGDTTAWDSFTSQFANDDEREAFMAFVYSIFVSKDKGRQVLWLKGIGNSGKTSAVNVIYECLSAMNPLLVKSVSNTNNFESDKFNTNGLDKCRLTILSDTRDRMLLTRPFVLQMSGADVISVRGMYQDVKTVKAYSKVIAVSNFAPIVDMTARHEFTRCLYLCLDDRLCLTAYNKWNDHEMGNWNDKLREEFGSFLAKCKEVYERIMLPDGSIPLTKIMLEKMSLDCSANYRNIIDAFRDNFCVDAEGSQVELTDLTAVIHKFIGSKFLNQGLKEEVIKSFIMKYKIDDLVISGVKTKIISGIRMVKKARFMAFSEWISLVSRGIDVRID